MFRRPPPLSREDILLIFWAFVLGIGGAAAFAAYRATSASEDLGGKVGEFAVNLAWPGALIFLGIAAVVWMGWKANLD